MSNFDQVPLVRKNADGTFIFTAKAVEQLLVLNDSVSNFDQVPLVRKNADGTFIFSAKAVDQLSVFNDSDGWCEVCNEQVEEDGSCSDDCVVNVYQAVIRRPSDPIIVARCGLQPHLCENVFVALEDDDEWPERAIKVGWFIDDEGLGPNRCPGHKTHEVVY